MHTVFHINDIKLMSENHRLFQVELTLTSDNDKDLRVLTDQIREDGTDWVKCYLKWVNPIKLKVQ